MNIKIKFNSWHKFIEEEKNKKYFIKIFKKLKEEKKKYEVFPRNTEIFNAFSLTCFNKIKVVIIGQDPYHKKKQAHGLCFSVKKNIKPPKSLQNIIKELCDDLKIKKAKTNNLKKWAEQGVLMLNSILTVRKGKPNSHKNIGWNIFTDKIIKKISDEKNDIIFLLWGNYAEKKIILINREKHTVLTSTHPSPLSAKKGFLGCKHFSKTNKILIKKNIEPINWNPS